MSYQPPDDVEKCKHPGCEEIQEFPDGPCDHCLRHSVSMYFYWRPLAEFGRYIEPNTGQEVGR